MPTETKQLPDLPSELLIVAMTDLEKIEADPENYRINMSWWHTAKNAHIRNLPYCSVCLAGSVMAKTLGIGPNEDASPSTFDRNTEMKLFALNVFREGSLKQGFLFMDIPLPSSLPFIYDEDSVIRYDESVDVMDPKTLDNMSNKDETRDEWKMHMCALIGILQAEGL